MTSPLWGCLLGLTTDCRDLSLLVSGVEELVVGEWTDHIPHGLGKCCFLPSISPVYNCTQDTTFRGQCGKDHSGELTAIRLSDQSSYLSWQHVDCQDSGQSAYLICARSPLARWRCRGVRCLAPKDSPKLELPVVRTPPARVSAGGTAV